MENVNTSACDLSNRKGYRVRISTALFCNDVMLAGLYNSWASCVAAALRPFDAQASRALRFDRETYRKLQYVALADTSVAHRQRQRGKRASHLRTRLVPWSQVCLIHMMRCSGFPHDEALHALDHPDFETLQLCPLFEKRFTSWRWRTQLYTIRGPERFLVSLWPACICCGSLCHQATCGVL